jgi:phosphinothricin acetyltransferase
MDESENSRIDASKTVREVRSNDAKAISEIYNYYVLETAVTFEEMAVTSDNIQSRIYDVESSNLPWLVGEEGDRIVGYAYAKRWKERSAYRYSVEVSVYVDHKLHQKGWGTVLYGALFDELRNRDIHLAIGGITLPNQASIALHEKFAMEKVAHFSEIGYKFGEWRDVGYWQKKL